MTAAEAKKLPVGTKVRFRRMGLTLEGVTFGPAGDEGRYGVLLPIKANGFVFVVDSAHVSRIDEGPPSPEPYYPRHAL